MNKAIYDTTTNRVVGTRSGNTLPPLEGTFAYVDYSPALTPDPRGLLVSKGMILLNSLAEQTLQEMEADLLDLIDDTREAAQMKVLSSGGAKKLIYMAKTNEYQDYFKVGAAVIAALNLQTQQIRFPYAFSEMALTGDTLAVVMARWGTAQAKATNETQRIEAIAVTGKRLVRAATTKAAKKAAFDAINWAWKPKV